MQKKAGYSIAALIIWTLLVILFMLLAYQVSLEIFFVLWLIALLIVAELVDTTTVQPQATRFLKYCIAVQVIVFGAIVARKVMEILSK